MRWLAALGLALLGHLALLGVILGLSAMENPALRSPASPPPTSVNMRTLSPEAWAQNRGEARRDPTQSSDAAPSPSDLTRDPVEPKPKPPKPEPKDGQHARVAPGNDKEAPDAKFLANDNNRVEKETRARETRPDAIVAQPRATTTEPEEQTNEDLPIANADGNGGTGNDKAEQKDGKVKGSMELPKIDKRDEIALRPRSDPSAAGPEVGNQTHSDELSGNSDRLNLSPGNDEATEGGSSGMAGGRIKLRPDGAVLDRIAGAAPSDLEHVEDLEEGDGTFLNTREWKYASFYDRVKQNVGQTWQPLARLRQRDPTGQIYGVRERFTLVNVRLNERGFVKEIWVEKSSGLDFLDLEAVASLERAQPFPNPPVGMRGPDGTVEFKFGFSVTFEGPGLSLFRRAN